MATMAKTASPRSTHPVALASRLYSEEGSFKVYKLDLEKRSMHSDIARQCLVKAENQMEGLYRKEKTILLVGQSGSGKSTLIDAMLNYIVGVKREDPYRFKLIDLTEREKRNAKHEAMSQTEMMTCYTIPQMYGSDIPFTVNLVDSPGTFCTEGAEKDRQHKEKIRSFFTKDCIPVLDAVCFVVKAPETRLNKAQHAIFDDMQEAFGKDVRENIFVFVTFCDNKKPKVLKTMEAARLPFKRHYCINNAELFERVPREDDADEKMAGLHWEMTASSMQEFFQNDLPLTQACSIEMTKDVCHKRQLLEERLGEMARKVVEELQTYELKRELSEKLKKVKFSGVQAYLKIEIQTDEYHPKKVRILKLGRWATNCKRCRATCHKHCLAFLDVLVRHCEIMKDGNCMVCTHPASDHRSSRNYLVRKKRIKTKTVQELMTEYGVETKTPEALVNAVDKDIREHDKMQMDVLTNIRQTIEELNQIALKSVKGSELDYLQGAIKSEQAEQKEGWNDRLRGLERLHENYKRQRAVASNTSWSASAEHDYGCSSSSTSATKPRRYEGPNRL